MWQLDNTNTVKTIMSVDSDLTEQENLKQTVSIIGNYHFVAIESNPNAVAYLLQSDTILPDVIIFGISSVDTDVFESLQHLTSHPTIKNVPLLIKFNSYINDELKTKIFNEGGDDYIETPLSSTILKIRLETLIQNNVLKQTLFYRNRELEVLNKISKKINHLYQLEDILKCVLDELTEIMNITSGAIFVIVQDEQKIQLRVERGLSSNQKSKVEHQLIDKNSGIAGQTAFNKQTIITEDGLISIPMMVTEQIVGVTQFHIKQNANQKQTLQQNQIALIESIVAQMAVKLENILIQLDKDQKNYQSAKVYHVNRTISQATNLKSIYQAVLDHVIDSSTNYAAIWLFDKVHRPGEALPITAEVVAAQNFGGSLSKTELLDLEELNFHDNIKRAEPLILTTIETHPSLALPMKQFLTQILNLQKVIFIPLLAQDAWAGVLLLGSNSNQTPSIPPETMHSYWLLAGQAATAIINLSLYQNAQRQTEELRVINKMGKTFVASLNPKQVLQAIINEVSSILMVDACSVFLVDEDTDELVFEAALHSLDTILPKSLRRLAPGQGIVGWVIEHGQPQLVPDVLLDDRFYTKIGEVTNLVTRSIICAPIIKANNVMGAIQAINSQVDAFTTQDLQLLVAAANHAAVALDNAKLHKDALQRLSEISILQTAGAKLTATLDFNELLKTVVTSAIILLEADSGSILLLKDSTHIVGEVMTIESDRTTRIANITVPTNAVSRNILKNSKVVIVPNTHEVDDLNDEIIEKNWAAFVGMPLKLTKRPLGVLYVSSYTPRQFAKHQLALLETFVSQAVLAIEHASLYQETRDNLKRTSALYEIAQTPRYLHNRDEVFKFIATTARNYLKIKRVLIFELENDNTFVPLYLPDVSSEKRAAYTKDPWHIEETFFQELKSGSPIKIDNLQDPKYDAFRKKIIYDDAQSWYAVPLQIETNLIGIMVFIGQDPAMIAQEEMVFPYTIAGHIAITLHNIRLIKELESQAETLRQTNQQLIEANQVKSRFLATMSHELRTPLHSIIGYSEVLQDELDGPLTPDQADSVERILRNGQNLLHLINDVLDLTKIEAGKLEIHFSYFPLYQVLDSVIEIVLPLAERKNLLLKIDEIHDAIIVYADKIQLRQVLLNLLSNAIKFTEVGHIEVLVVPKDNEAFISVKDTGIGIPPEEIPRLFDEFHQVESGMTREYSGTGLGLSIVQHLVGLMNGCVFVESEIDKGSIFTITLPLAKTKT